MKLRLPRSSLYLFRNRRFWFLVGAYRFPAHRTRRLGSAGMLGPIAWTWIPDADPKPNPHPLDMP